MECGICGKSSDEVELFKGISEDGLINVCEQCAEDERIPVIRKPSSAQLETADKRFSVRERMEKMSGMDKNRISPEQREARRFLTQLRAPPTKEHSELLIDNYDWEIKMGRRRTKTTISQLSTKTGVSIDELNAFEKGILPEKIEEVAEKVEIALNIKILTEHGKKVIFSKTQPSEEDEKKILFAVQEKLREQKKAKVEEKKPLPEEKKDKEEKLARLKQGELDLSRREELKNLTLTDLIDRKKKRDKREEALRKQKQAEDMFGQDLEVEGLENFE